MIPKLGQYLKSQFFYSNIKITTNRDLQVAYLTLSQDKKRNPLSLATIKEIHAGLNEI